jgi:hypothetical protein
MSSQRSTLSILTSRHIRERQHFSVKLKWDPSDFSAKNCWRLLPAAAPAVLPVRSNPTRGLEHHYAMTRRDFVKPAFSLRKQRYVKTHALSLLGTTRLLSRSVRKLLGFVLIASNFDRVETFGDIAPCFFRVTPSSIKRNGWISPEGYLFTRAIKCVDETP